MDSHNLTLSSPLGGERCARGGGGSSAYGDGRDVRTPHVGHGRRDAECGGPQFNPAPEEPSPASSTTPPSGGTSSGTSAPAAPTSAAATASSIRRKRRSSARRSRWTPVVLRRHARAHASRNRAPASANSDRRSEDLSQRQLQELYCGRDWRRTSRKLRADPALLRGAAAAVREHPRERLHMTPARGRHDRDRHAGDGRVRVTSSVRTLVYLTSFGVNRIRARAALNNVCDGGQRAGRACTVGPTPDETSLDCRPTTRRSSCRSARVATSTTAMKTLASDAGASSVRASSIREVRIPAVRRIQMTGAPPATVTARSMPVDPMQTGRGAFFGIQVASRDPGAPVIWKRRHAGMPNAPDGLARTEEAPRRSRASSSPWCSSPTRGDRQKNVESFGGRRGSSRRASGRP